MSRHSLRDLSDSIRREVNRFTDLQLNLAAQDDNGTLGKGSELLLSVGGQWDRVQKRYTDELSRAQVLGLHGGQVEAARWLVKWFEARAQRKQVEERGQPLYSLLLHGGRRAGKTDLGAKAGVAYALFRPCSYIWLVSENQQKTEELEAVVRGWLPPSWYEWRGEPWFQFQLVNGSIIWLRSAHNPTALKRGRADFVVLNEAQNMAEETFATVRAATADNGGLTVLACNPPENPIGFWIERFYEEARAGKRPAKEFHLDATKNPHINHASLTAMKAEVDDRTFRREILGEFLPRVDVVFHAWSTGVHGNVRPVPEVGNITREFTKRKLHREFDAVLGVDLQKSPVVAVEIQAFHDTESTDGEPLLWMANAVIVEEGYEDDLSAALIAAGYDPARTALIVDASGSWQGIDRQRKIPSFDLLKQLGWRHIYKPDQNIEKNPVVLERVRCANMLMKSASGKRRLFSSPDVKPLNEALKLWQNRHGTPDKSSEFAHLCDAATYPLWRFYPRAAKKAALTGTAGIKTMDVAPKGPRIL